MPPSRGGILPSAHFRRTITLLVRCGTLRLPHWKNASNQRHRQAPFQISLKLSSERREERMSLTKPTTAIRVELCRIRGQIKAGNDSEILIWLLNGNLACSQRPLRDHPDYGVHLSDCQCGCCRPPLPPKARSLVVDWVERVKSSGIRSIVSLLEEKQHEKYYIRGGLDLHPEGLYGYYRSQGFEFCAIPIADSPRSLKSNMGRVLEEKVLEAFDQMPKPVLLHCSAGIDRTSPVAAYIVSKRSTKP